MSVEPLAFGGKTLEEWDREWAPVVGDLNVYQPQLRYLVGLYRVSMHGRVMAIGTGTDKDGGLAKRLSDFSRPSSSGRNHHAGKLIRENLDHVKIEVLITGERHEPKIARLLKAAMIKRHKPIWSVPNPQT